MSVRNNPATEITQWVDLYTDGACSGNPGQGGWGAVILLPDSRQEAIHGGEESTTNNQMELMAAIKALEWLDGIWNVNLYTDSRYLCDGMMSWLSDWKRRGWKNSRGTPVKNKQLWERLDKIASQHQVQWFWVKAHAGNVFNERADALARQGIDELPLRANTELQANSSEAPMPSGSGG